MLIETYHSVIEQQKVQLNIAKIKRESECPGSAGKVKVKGSHTVNGSVNGKIKREREQGKSERCSPCRWKCQWQNKKRKVNREKVKVLTLLMEVSVPK